MPVYIYKGVDSAGKNVNGSVDAENERSSRSKLRKMGIYPTSIKPEGSGAGLGSISFSKKVKTEDLAHMTRQIATLLDANIPLVDTLKAIQDQLEHPILKKSMAGIKDKVVEGQRLADAMRVDSHIYNDLYIYMIKAGEASGALDKVLNRLADFTEYQARLIRKIRGALMYPAILIIISMALLMYLLTSVVPKIAGMFDEAGQALPTITQVVLAISNFMQSYWYVIILGIFASFIGFKKYVSMPKGAMKYDRFKLKAPILGGLFQKVSVSRFARTLSTLLSSGVQLLQALDIVKHVVNNKVIEEAIENTRESVREGDSIVEPLKRSGQFPTMVIHMIGVGEKTGSLELMLEKIANNYDEEVDSAVTGLTTVIEPVIIAVMGAAVFTIVLSVMLPILQMLDF